MQLMGRRVIEMPEYKGWEDDEVFIVDTYRSDLKWYAIKGTSRVHLMNGEPVDYQAFEFLPSMMEFETNGLIQTKEQLFSAVYKFLGHKPKV